MEGKAYFDSSFLEKFWKENLEYIKSEVDLYYQKVEKFWKENLEYIKSEVDFNYQKVFQIFGKRVTVFVVFDRAQVRNSLVLRNQMVEDKLFSLIERDVVQQEQFAEWLFERITDMKDRHDRIDYMKESYKETTLVYLIAEQDILREQDGNFLQKVMRAESNKGAGWKVSKK